MQYLFLLICVIILTFVISRALSGVHQKGYYSEKAEHAELSITNFLSKSPSEDLGGTIGQIDASKVHRVVVFLLSLAFLKMLMFTIQESYPLLIISLCGIMSLYCLIYVVSLRTLLIYEHGVKLPTNKIARKTVLFNDINKITFTESGPRGKHISCNIYTTSGDSISINTSIYNVTSFIHIIAKKLDIKVEEKF